MRVLHLVASSTMTGPADPALQLAAAQRRFLGYDARIAFDSRRPGDMTQRAAEHAVPVEPGLIVCTKGSLADAWRDRRRLRALADECDVVHVHASHDHALATFAKGRAPLIRSIHHPRSTERRAFQRLAYDRTDGFITVASRHRERLLASYPSIDASRIAVVPGAVDPERYHQGADGAALRQAHRIPEGAFVVGMVARFQAGRGQIQLLEAIAAAHQRSSPPVHLALIGKGETQPEIERAIRRLGLEDGVHLYGFRDADLPDAFASCDVTVLLREGNDASCRAVLQSLACGVPVIGARYAAIEDAIGHEQTGLLIPPDDLGALRSAIEWIVDLPEAQRAEMAAQARANAVGRFTEKARAEAVDRFYAVVADRTPA